MVKAKTKLVRDRQQFYKCLSKSRRLGDLKHAAMAMLVMLVGSHLIMARLMWSSRAKSLNMNLSRNIGILTGKQC